ncbi:MAG: right-handed parallel beta-helix repeat-containing protein [Methanosphaera sp.]|nr:right-handed parallel beta-helix repeat-containing protein [Methanosphaera sp.]
MILVSTVSAYGDNSTADSVDEIKLDSALNENDVISSQDNDKNLKSASKQTYYVTNKNMNKYFDDDGVVNSKVVANGSTIILNDTFNDKTFIMEDSAITLSGIKGKTILYNSSIFIESSPVIISNLTINNTNDEIEKAILIDANNVTIDNCKIIVNSTSDAYGIYSYGNNTKVTNNVISVAGPSDEINWESDVAKTLSLVMLSNNNIITNNSISVYSSIDKANPGTIEAVSLQGDFYGRTSLNNTFSNNTIVAQGNSYVYGLNLGNTVDNNRIENNNIQVQGGYFGDCIQIFSSVSNSIINNNTIFGISYNLADGIVISKDNMGGQTNNNTITNNKINIIGNVTNLIEIYRATNTLIENNTISSTSNIAGAIVATGQNVIIRNNHVKVNASYANSTPISFKASNIASITDNEVESNCDYSVELSNSTNVNVTGNLLNSTTKGDLSVNYTNKKNIVKNNTPSRIIETKTTTGNIKAKINEKITLTAKVTSTDGTSINNGYVIFKVNNQSLKDKNNTLIKAYVKNSQAKVNYTVDKSWNKENLSIVAIYSGSNNIMGSRSSAMKINVSKRDAKVTVISSKKSVQGGDTIDLTVIVMDGSTSVNGGQVLFKLNGQTMKDKNGQTILVNIKNGYATASYVFDNGLSSKNCTITAVYSNSIYNRAEGTTNIFINKSRPEIIMNNIKTKTNTTKITGKIVEINGKAIRGTTQVAIKVNGQTFAVVAAVNGIINTTINTNFKPGIYKLKVVAGENYRYFANSLETILEKQ